MYSRLKLDIDWRTLIWAAAGRRSSEQDAEAARAAIRKTFAPRHVVVGLSVRTIFDALLSEVALAAGAPVLMSGVNIQNMADIVVAHDFRVAAVDVAPDTLAPLPGALVAAQAELGANICVVTQLFGAANRFDDLQILKERGVLVVEDAAQAFAGAAHLGLPEADVSLFSFGPIKRRTALGGGVAVFQDARLAARVEERLGAYPVLPERWLRQRALKYLLLKAASTPWIYALLMRAVAASGRDPDAVIGGAARGFGGQTLLKAIKQQPPRRMAVLLAHQILTSPSADRRRQICDAFADALPKQAHIGARATGNAYWLMPVRAADPEKFVAHLRATGFDATRGATSLRALDSERTEHARELIANVVYVPNPADLAPDARRRLAKAVVEALQQD